MYQSFNNQLVTYDPISKKAIKKDEWVKDNIEISVSFHKMLVHIYSDAEDGKLILLGKIKLSLTDNKGFCIGTLTSMGGVDMLVNVFFDLENNFITIDYPNFHQKTIYTINHILSNNSP